MRMLVVVAVLGLAGTAHADDVIRQLGVSAIADPDPGWGLRFDTAVFDRRAVTGGARVGIEYWRGPRTSGMSFPIEVDLMVHKGDLRSTLGAGAGLLAGQWGHAPGDVPEGFGISPFVAATVSSSFGRHIMTLEARATRRVFVGMSDATMFGITLLVGAVSDD
jgi:hypothetical protein